MYPSVADLDARAWSRVFRALGDETRVRIVALLSHGELCVCHLEAGLALPQPTISRQLGVLRAAGLVEHRRAGSWMHYRLVEQADPQVRNMIEGVTRTFAARRALRADVARIKKQCGPGACA
jgi:ArsR family transcriptional regulator